MLSRLGIFEHHIINKACPGAGTGTGSGSDYQSGTPRGTGATGTGSNYDTGSNQGAALTSGNVRSYLPGGENRGEQVIDSSKCSACMAWYCILFRVIWVMFSDDWPYHLVSCESSQHSLCYRQRQLCVVKSNVVRVSSMGCMSLSSRCHVSHRCQSLFLDSGI